MRPRPARMHAELLLLIAAIVASACLTACTQPKPVSYSMGRTIGMGSLELLVQRTEAFSESNARALSVHVNVNGIRSNEQGLLLTLMSHRRFELTDSSGKSYKCLGVIPADSFYKALSEAKGDYRGARGWGDTWLEDTGSSAPIPKEWVLLFAVPMDAKGFTLLIDNAKAKRDQPLRMSVKLDR